MEQPGYEDDICYFCHGNEAGYQIPDKNNKMQDACETCVKKRIEEK